MNERLLRALSRIDQVEQSESAFSDAPALWVNGHEIAHFEGDQALDIRLTRAEIRARRAELRADNRVRLRASSSDWITVTIANRADEAFVASLVAAAAAAHRSLAGTIAAPPPQGSDLARRRRFH